MNKTNFSFQKLDILSQPYQEINPITSINEGSIENTINQTNNFVSEDSEGYQLPISAGDLASQPEPEVRLSIAERRVSVKIKPLQLYDNNSSRFGSGSSALDYIDVNIKSNLQEYQNISSYSSRSMSTGYNQRTPTGAIPKRPQNMFQFPSKQSPINSSSVTPTSATSKTKSQIVFFGDDNQYQNIVSSSKPALGSRNNSLRHIKRDSGVYSPNHFQNLHANPVYCSIYSPSQNFRNIVAQKIIKNGHMHTISSKTGSIHRKNSIK